MNQRHAAELVPSSQSYRNDSALRRLRVCAERDFGTVDPQASENIPSPKL